MELNQLKLFLDLVREGSFTRVAKQNRVTQPAVSLQIQRLESELGATLLERTTRRVLVTDEGRLLASYAREILARVAEAREALEERRGQVMGSVRIAAIHSVGLHELPDYLKRFIRRYPDVHLHIEYHPSDEVYSRLAEGAADVGLVAYPELRDSLVAIPFLEDEMVLVTAPDSVLAGSGAHSVRLEDLEGQDLIAFDGNIPTRRATDRLLEVHGIHMNVRMECDNVEVMKKMVEVGLGVAFVPHYSVREESDRQALRILRLRDVTFRRPLAAIHRKGQPLSRPAEAFLAVLTGTEPPPPGVPDERAVDARAPGA